MPHPSSPATLALLAQPATPPAPGDLTVPLLSGWQGLAAGVLLLAVAAVAVLALATARTGTSERSDWQAWLAARPSRHPGPADDTADDPADGVPDAAVPVADPATGR